MSGITQFDTGAIRDSQEGKEDLIEGISWLALKRFAKYMDGKAAKYGRGNWKKGIPPEQAIKSMTRHMQKLISEWEYGICDEHDDHASAILFNLQILMHELELIRLGKGRFKVSKEYASIYEEYDNREKRDEADMIRLYPGDEYTSPSIQLPRMPLTKEQPTEIGQGHALRSCHALHALRDLRHLGLPKVEAHEIE